MTRSAPTTTTAAALLLLLVNACSASSPVVSVTDAGAGAGGVSFAPRGGAEVGVTALRTPPPHSNGTSAATTVLDDDACDQSCGGASLDGASGGFDAPAATFVDSSHSRAKTSLSSSASATVAEIAAEERDVETDAFVDEDDDVSSEEVEEAAPRTPEEVEAEIEKLTENKGAPLRVLFLSADTGGGHRASAESLAKSFQEHYPGTIYDLLDVWSPTGIWPYYTLVPAYKHMSNHPRQWKLFYHLSNNILYELAYDFHTWLTCERDVRRRIDEFDPDVVVSVHPTMNNVPMISTRKVAKKRGKSIPFFTVVTDFGSAHTTWFQKGVDGMFVASDRIRKLAKRRGRVADDKLVMSGLPIRHDFAVQAERLGDRTSERGVEYQREVREKLGFLVGDPDRKMVLVMGGGEGVGSLSDIVDGLYAKFRKAGTDATIYVVCGRNEKLKKELETRCWDTVLQQSHLPKKKFSPLSLLRPRRSRRIQRALDKARAKAKAEEKSGRHHAPGRVDVVGLGFVTNMDEYMVAADVLVTKAGPGTIAEAAAVGLPVMLTSFLPGQEAGNVNVVLDGGFGDYCEDPDGIADEVSCWLGNARLMRGMSRRAREVGCPHAASDIALEIGLITHRRKGEFGASTN